MYFHLYGISLDRIDVNIDVVFLRYKMNTMPFVFCIFTPVNLKIPIFVEKKALCHVNPNIQ